MFNIQTLYAAAIAAVIATPSFAADVGVRQISLTAAPTDYGRDLHVTVWYPAEGGGEPVMIGANRVFEGEPSRHDQRLFHAGRHAETVAAGGGPVRRHRQADR